MRCDAMRCNAMRCDAQARAAAAGSDSFLHAVPASASALSLLGDLDPLAPGALEAVAAAVDGFELLKARKEAFNRRRTLALRASAAAAAAGSREAGAAGSAVADAIAAGSALASNSLFFALSLCVRFSALQLFNRRLAAVLPLIDLAQVGIEKGDC